MKRLSPPSWADVWLTWLLPDGVKGVTIIADLHAEFDEVVRERRHRYPRIRYAMDAFRLGLRYQLLRLRRGSAQVDGRTHREGFMATFWADLRFGVRMLWKTPGLSLIAVVTIALGVGFTTHTYSSVYGSVIRGLPVPDSDQLVNIDESNEELGFTRMSLPLHDYIDVRDQQTVFTDVAAGYQGTVNLAGDEGPPERFQGAFLTANGLEVTRVPPLLGRTFQAGEDAFDAPPLIVLSYHVWQNRFAGDRDIVGRTVRANGLTTEIIGVMPEGFNFPFAETVWLTHRQDPASLERRDGIGLVTYARLRPGVTMEVAAAELETIALRLEATYPEASRGVRFGIRPYAEAYMPKEITAVLWVMLFATFGVLLIACANVANLLLARASLRSREVAVRTAMGASRGRVIRQLLVEAGVLALVGGALGLVLAWVGIDLFNAALVDIEKPYWIDIRVDGPALTFALGVTMLASVAAGTIPAIRASGLGLGEILKDEGRGSSSFRLGRFSTALVIGEIAVSCGLLIAAGLMIKSVANLRTLDLGFEPDAILTGRVGLFDADYPEQTDRQQFFQRLVERLEAEPGFESAALTTSLPALGASGWFVNVEGETYLEERDYPLVNGAVITDGFFEAIGVSMIQGREFSRFEAWDDSDPAAVVNESFVSEVLHGRDPLGTRFRLGRGVEDAEWIRIVGVVPDLHVGGGVGGIGDDLIDPEQIYLPAGITDVRFMSAVIRTQGPPSASTARLREIVVGLDANLPVYQLGSVAQGIRQSTWAFGLFGSLFTIFGIAALFMAAVGLYGVMAFSVNQRRQEMGVRMALGAGPREIRRMVLKRGVIQLAIGMVLGLGLGYALTRPMAVVTFQVDLTDPLVYVAILSTLAVAGVAACLVPARAATRANPVEAMRP